MNTEGIKGHHRQIKILEFLLKNKTIPQVILFSGMSGIGKRLLANRFLNALFCTEDNSPCLNCPACRQIALETFPDYIEIHPNEKGIIPIGNEETPEKGSIRWLIERLSSRSISGTKGILIDGLDRITEEGQNALLKTIEEPTQGTYFILISSNRSNLLPTILSRCTEIKYFSLSDRDVKEILLRNNPTGNMNVDTDLILSLSGGSLEIAYYITNNDIFNSVIELCQAITSFFSKGKYLDIDPILTANKIGIELLFDIVINIFRQNLLAILKEEKIHPFLENIYIDDKIKVMNIIRKMLLLKKGISRNLNIKYALKSMLYSV